MNRLALCRGSWLKEQNAPKKEENAACKRGNKIHSCLEGRITLKDLSYSDAKMADRIMCTEALLVDKHGFEGATVIREERNWVLDSEFNEVLSAKPDVTYLKGKTALVINYKTGWLDPVPIGRNWQVATEVLSVMESHGVTLAVGAIATPNAGREYQDKIFDKSMPKIKIIQMAKQAVTSEELTPGKEQCEFCRAYEICTAHGGKYGRKKK